MSLFSSFGQWGEPGLSVDAGWDSAPRPRTILPSVVGEYAPVNPANPLLLAFRQDILALPGATVAGMARQWVEHDLFQYEPGTPEHIEHARRVIGRLAGVSDVPDVQQ